MIYPRASGIGRSGWRWSVAPIRKPFRRASGLLSSMPPLLNQIPPSGVIPILLGLARDADDCLDRSPREAWGLASAAYCAAQALGDARTLAETALTLAIVLNRLGDFREARTSAEQATTLATHAGDQDRAARAMFEAAWGRCVHR